MVWVVEESSTISCGICMHASQLRKLLQEASTRKEGAARR